MWNVLADAMEDTFRATAISRSSSNEFLVPPVALPTSASGIGEKIRSGSYSLADQAFAVGGMFLANVALARAGSKEEYGIFALCYSFYTFLAGLHNALILEPYTVFGSGRYHKFFCCYARLMRRTNAALCLGLSGLFVATWVLLRWLAPHFAMSALLGMALACSFLLTGAFIRRSFYIQRRPNRAAQFSFVFFAVLTLLLYAAIRVQWLSGFSTFAVAGASWAVASLAFVKVIPGRGGDADFKEIEGGYWSEHWKYARWVLATAFVFQLMTQSYYWIVAGFLSVKDLASLRAMHLLVMPVDQVFTAITLLILPMLALRYATGQHRALISLWGKFALLFFGISVVFAATVHTLSLPLLHLLYGGKFDDLAGLLGLLVLVPVVMGVGNSTNAALKAIEQPHAVFWAYVASGCVTFLAGIPLVIHFGLRGAVYGMLLSAIAYTMTLLALWMPFRVGAGRSQPV
jgi:O-antigen/teichoic acid export membrane protein